MGDSEELREQLTDLITKLADIFTYSVKGALYGRITHGIHGR